MKTIKIGLFSCAEGEMVNTPLGLHSNWPLVLLKVMMLHISITSVQHQLHILKFTCNLQCIYGDSYCKARPIFIL